MKFLVFGGNTDNKGAEAMTLILVNEIRRKYPNAEIIIAVSEPEYKRVKQQGLSVDIIVFHSYDYFNPHRFAGYRELLGGINKIIDISGYMLSSDFQFKYSVEFLCRILLAKLWRKPIYILPQSFGPLLFKKKYERIVIEKFLKILMPYPKIVFAREEKGYLEMAPYCKGNLKKSMDMVLTYQGNLDLEMIYKKELHSLEEKSVMKNSVAIVPNRRNITNGCGEAKMKEIYSIIIDRIISNGKNVYLIPHSVEDIDVCKNIKKKYGRNERVFLVEKDLHCFEFETLISKFDYAIVSRYHALVHAYKSAVPCLVLGWAIKYEELAKAFQQSKYVVDTRKKISAGAVIRKLQCLDKSYMGEKEIIKERYMKINQSFSFDWL